MTYASFTKVLRKNLVLQVTIESKKVHFQGHIQKAIRFIAQHTMTCEPIFRLLKKEVPIVWNEQFQEAFEKIKNYLMKQPILVLSVPEKPLLLYLTTTI